MMADLRLEHVALVMDLYCNWITVLIYCVLDGNTSINITTTQQDGLSNFAHLVYGIVLIYSGLNEVC